MKPPETSLLEGESPDDGDDLPMVPKGRLFSHGGARRMPLQPSDGLRKSQCLAVIRAAERAVELGKPMNRFITLVWKLGGIGDHQAAALTRSFIKLASEWMRVRDGSLCWTFVHEWGPINGTHSHVLLHVPPRLKHVFRPMPVRWAAKLLPDGYVKDVVDTQRVAGADAPDQVSRDLYDHALCSRLRYMLKAADPAWEIELGLQGYGDVPWGQRSQVLGKRIGCWQERRAHESLNRDVAGLTSFSQKKRVDGDNLETPRFWGNRRLRTLS